MDVVTLTVVLTPVVLAQLTALATLRVVAALLKRLA